MQSHLGEAITGTPDARCYESCANAESTIRNWVSASEMRFTFYNTQDPKSCLAVCKKCQERDAKLVGGRGLSHAPFCPLSQSFLKNPLEVKKEREDSKRLAKLKQPPVKDRSSCTLPWDHTLHRHFSSGPCITPKDEVESFLSTRTEKWLREFQEKHYLITTLRAVEGVREGLEPPRDTWKDVIIAALDHAQYPFHCLLMLMCLGRVMDRTLKQDFRKLFHKYNSLSPQDLLDMSISEFESYLGHLGMAETRTQHLMLACGTIVEDFNGDEVPDTVKGLYICNSWITR